MVNDLTAWEVEQLRRSVAMLPAGSPAGLNREDALMVLGQLRHSLALLEHPATAEAPGVRSSHGPPGGGPAAILG
jgi:hypothetical protein